MIKRNKQLEQFKKKYLFPEIAARKRQFLEKNPHAQLISLGIGDTTEPLSSNISQALVAISGNLATADGYIGYGPEQGIDALREKIATVLYEDKVAAEEIFISDGAKCDIGRLQLLFGKEVSIAVQDPAYPVYVDGSRMQGVEQIHMMPCTPENGFFPDLQAIPRVDLLYFCSPNNPTGAAYTYEQLEQLVAYAKRMRTIILFDAAYSAYIRDEKLPKTIYAIPGAEEVAIEIGSFSKFAGFTGVRLAWTVIPESLKYTCGTSVRSDWNRLTTTLFNGASIIAQHGGIATLEENGLKDIDKQISLYLENAHSLKKALLQKGYAVYGGENAPYLWVHFPGKNSWDVFQEFLEKAHLVTIPGVGFGSAGEGFIRLSAFGKREDIFQAAQRIKSSLLF